MVNPNTFVPFLLCVAAAGACGQAPQHTDTVPPSDLRLHQSQAVDAADGVHQFTSLPWSFETNSYWIEGPTGVVVIDTQFLPSEAELLLANIEATTSKPVVLALVLHPNPDKFNGADVFRARGIPVKTSSQVLEWIPRVAEQRRRAFLSRYRPDYPQQDPEIESLGSESTSLQVAGLTLQVHVLGRGCSEAHMVVSWNGHLFAGDLVPSGSHAWLELGYVRDWLARIDELRALQMARIHPGRGPSGDATLLDDTSHYLHRVAELSRAATGDRSTAAERVQTQLQEEFPSLGYRVFLRGVPRVIDNIRSED